MCRRTLITPILILSLSAPGLSQLRSIETEKLRLVFYDPNHTYLAPQLMRAFENAYIFNSDAFQYVPPEKITVLLEDFGDFGHGGADVIPGDRISLGVAPFSYVYETMPANERMSWIMNHELVHVFAMDKPTRTDRILRNILGGKVSPNADDPISMVYAFLTSPRRYSPRWYHEGIAVFMETWMAGGLGRALGGYDEMVFRAIVRDRGHIYDSVGLESEGTTIDFQVGANSYLYGTRFMSFIAHQYGPEKLLEWVRQSDRSKMYFASQFRQVFGRSLDGEWSRWIRFERKWQNDNLDRIRQYAVTPLHPISPTALGSVSRAYYEPRQRVIYAAVRYPGQMAHLAAIHVETGAIRKICDVEGAALFYVCSLAFDPTQGRLFYTTTNNDWRDLHVADVSTGKSKKLIKDFRAGDLVYDRNDRSLWGVRHHNGLSILVRVQEPYEAVQTIHAFPYGTDVYDLDISPDGRHLTAAIVDMNGMQKLVKFRIDKLEGGDASWEVIHDFEYSSPANFVFSQDGRYLYGTSYYTGASNVFRINFETNELEALSNSETGIFRPLAQEDGSLLAFEYTAKGFLPIRLSGNPVQDVSAVKYLGQEIVEKYPVVKSWKLGSPAAIDLARLTTSSGPYRPLRSMKLAGAYPIIQGYKDEIAYGARFDFTDSLGLSGLAGTVAYSPGASLPLRERVHLGFNYHYWQWKVSGYYNNADFYDLFGPTKYSRKGYALLFDHNKNLRFKPPRRMDLEWGVAGYGGLDRLPEYQNVAAPFDKFLTGKISLNYSYLEKSLGAVDDEKGIKWQAASRVNIVNSKAFPRIYGNFDYGFLLPLHNSPVWLRASAGRSFGSRTEPFANFYFGGFGNNWVDKREVSRYREYYSFPGVDLNQIGATDYVKGLAEWNLPALKFRRFGSPFLYCNWSRLSLFSSGIVGNIASAPDRQKYVNAGAQMDFRIVLFSYMNSTFSVGYAAAAGKDGKVSREFMISLKLQ